MADALEKPSKPKAVKKTGRQRVDQEISSPNSITAVSMGIIIGMYGWREG